MEVDDAAVFAIFRKEWLHVLECRIGIAQVQPLDWHLITRVHVEHDAHALLVSRRILQQLNPNVLILGHVKSKLQIVLQNVLAGIDARNECANDAVISSIDCT